VGEYQPPNSMRLNSPKKICQSDPKAEQAAKEKAKEPPHRRVLWPKSNIRVDTNNAAEDGKNLIPAPRKGE
jgi:hypothetical protein